ncbi:MAG: hypothetical protein IM628_10610 [Phenylobacterium sp.]|uniref:hypothetical protein n=1 Tax=Phenylobacterium sp. TaxID=1871053 RepID=UPI0025E2CFCA|nr:hypothetical protein [Phenylobacterium sp.]MCA6305253.1 hypothetical protein [Phenylobacterium sp.]
MTAARSAPHPDWPPICLACIAALLDGETTADELAVARRFMGDLTGHPELLARARAMEATAVASVAAAARVRRPAPGRQRVMAAHAREAARGAAGPQPSRPAAVGATGRGLFA